MGDRNTYPYPTPEQINKDDPKSFSSHEVTDYNSAVAKMKKAYDETPNGRAKNEGIYNDPHLTGDEKAAYDKYTDKLMYEWKAPIDTSAPTWDGHDQTYKPGTDYTGAPHGTTNPELPPPVAGGEDGNANLVVNTEAIKTFRTNLAKLREVLATTRTNVENMPDIKPGYFGLGGSLHRAVIGNNGAPGLRENTGTFLNTTVITFDKLMADIDTMCKEYDSVDELNSLTAEKLNKQFDDAFAAMGNLGTPGV